MTDLQITGLAGDTRAIGRDALDTFVAGLEGSVLYPHDAGFAEATLLWNGMIEKRPAMVVWPANVQVITRCFTANSRAPFHDAKTGTNGERCRILRTQLSHLGVLDDAHVSLFIVTNDAAAAEEDRVLWEGRNLRDA